VTTLTALPVRRALVEAVRQPLHVHVAVQVLERVLQRHDVHAVALQVAFESKGLKPGYHISGSRVETRRFQAMGQLHPTCTASPRRTTAPSTPAPDVAVQVGFESKGLKPVSHLIGSRVEMYA
jgi:hypothetical protein